VTRIGWGIIGIGGHAEENMAPAIVQQTDRARLVAVASRDRDRADEFGKRHGGARGLSSYEELLSDPEVEIVLIATPNALHADQVVAAARAGKHVLCDKPLGITAADAERAVEACGNAGVKLGITFQTRYTQPAHEVHDLIASRALGDLLIVQAEHGSGRVTQRGWRTNQDLAGLGVIFNLGVHTYDLVRYLVGAEVREVMAMFDGGPPETQVLALLRFTNGAMAYVNVNHTVTHRQNDLVAYGSNGRVVGRNMTRHNMQGELNVITDDGEETSSQFSTADAYQRVVLDMMDAIRDDRDPLANGVDGLRSIQIAEALVLSARHGALARVAD